MLCEMFSSLKLNISINHQQIERHILHEANENQQPLIENQ